MSTGSTGLLERAGNAFPGRKVMVLARGNAVPSTKRRCQVPNLDKATKEARDRAVIEGMRKHGDGWKDVFVDGEPLTKEQFVKPFTDHLRAMRRVRELQIALATAIDLERELDAAAKKLFHRWTAFAASRVGAHSMRMHEFFVVPHKEPKMSAETKAQAVVKRRETRKRLGTMGKKQRHFAKKKLRGG
jgi:hypothetical protein